MICPLLTAANFSGGTMEKEECKKSECAWWIEIYTTENRREAMCAIEAMATKNAKGLIVV